MNRARFVDAEGKIGNIFLVFAERGREHLDRFGTLCAESISFFLEHSSGEGHRQAADLATTCRGRWVLLR